MFMKNLPNKIKLTVLSAMMIAAVGIANGANNSSLETTGVTATTVKVGFTGPQTGPVAVYDAVRQGLACYFNYVNNTGGVNGRKIEFIAYDDQYQPAQTVKLAKRLVEEDKVFAMVANVGTPTNEAVKDYYIKEGVPVILVGAGSKDFVDPPIKTYMGQNTFNYENEARILANFAISRLGAKRIALAYANDDLGVPPARAAKKEIEKSGKAKVVEEVTFQANSIDLSSQAAKLQRAQPDAILVFAVPGPTAKLKKELYKIGANKAAFIVTSVTGNTPEMFDLAGPKAWEGVYSAGIVPSDPTHSKKPGAEVFVREFSKCNPKTPVAGWAQNAWAAGQVFVEGLKRTKTLTRTNFLDAFYTMDNWQGSLFAGVTFSPKNHYGLTSLFLTKVEKGKVVPITGSIVYDPVEGVVKWPEN